MKKNFLYTGIIFAFMALFFGCKEKDEFSVAEFSVAGLKINTGYDNTPKLFKTLPDGEEIGNLEAETEYTIVKADATGETLHIRNEDKSVDGWVYTNEVTVDKEVFLRYLKPLLEGNKTAFNLAHSVDENALTFEEKMEALQFIIDFIGKDKFKDFHFPCENGDAIAMAFRYTSPSWDTELSDHTTNQIHLLADCANITFLDWYYAYASSLYQSFLKDSQGLTCEMRAIKAQNYDALQYYFEKGFLEYYYKHKFNTFDSMKVAELIATDKDDEGHDLNYYLSECTDENIKKFVTTMRFSIPDIFNNASNIIENKKNDTIFNLINLLYAPLPYTAYNNQDEKFAYVYLEDDNWEKDYEANLNLRSEAGTDSKVVGKLPFGTKVDILDVSSEKSEVGEIKDYWYKVSANGIEGWCFGSFLVVPVNYEDLDNYQTAISEYEDEMLSERLTQNRREFKWLYQYNFEKRCYYTVMKEAKVYTDSENFFTVKPFEEVMVLQKIKTEDQDYFYDYGDLDSNFPCDFYNRYNYYLVLVDDKVGIIGGSALAHCKMYVDIEAFSGSEPDFDIYYTYLVDEDYYSYGVTRLYADLYEANPESHTIRKLKYGKLRGMELTLSPVDWDRIENMETLSVDITSYREFTTNYTSLETNKKELRSYYSIVFNVSAFHDDWATEKYIVFTVNKKYGIAYEGASFAKGYSNDYNSSQGVYGYFTSEEGQMPEVTFGYYGSYKDYDDESYVYHRFVNGVMDPDDFFFTFGEEESCPYLPEW